MDMSSFVQIGRRSSHAVSRPAPMHIVLFGAGHVGHALIALLGSLPCVVQWVDERDELFPDEVPANVQVEATDTPDAIVDTAPAGAYFLVMTHNHALDFSLAARIMRRRDFTYFGMIGSKTKRVKFERRLMERGVDPERLEEMTCPIGVGGIVDKAPQSIAVAVCAELLQVRSRETVRPVSERLHPWRAYAKTFPTAPVRFGLRAFCATRRSDTCDINVRNQPTSLGRSGCGCHN
jgi:xanthine dehydrogenase accessory factor